MLCVRLELAMVSRQVGWEKHESDRGADTTARYARHPGDLVLGILIAPTDIRILPKWVGGWCG